MLKTFKKSIALFVALVFVMSLMPFGVMAEVPETTSVVIPVQNYGTCHANSADKASSLTTQNKVTTICTARRESNRAYGYGQFDLSGYEEILENPSTEVTYSLYLGGDFGSSKCSNLKVQLFNDESDFADTSITYNQAAALGLHGTGAMVILQQTASDGQQKGTVTKPVDVAGLVSVLQSGTDNSIVCYAASTTTSGPVYYQPGYKNTGLTINYDSAEIDDAAYVTKIANALSWEEFSAEDINSVENDLVLPTKYRGADVTWSSDNESAVSSQGIVTFGKGSVSANLTATLTYKGIASENAVTATKTFVVTPASEPTVTSPVLRNISPKSSRSKNKDSVSDPADQSGTKVLEISKGGGDNDRYAYGQFDLSGYEEILGNPGTKITYKVKAGVGYGANHAYDFKVQLFNDESDYNPNTLTYTTAANLGLHGAGVYTMFERTDKTPMRPFTSSAEVDVEALNNVLRSGYDDSIVTYAFSTTSANSTHIQANSDNEGLVITYFASEIDNEAYVNDLEDEFTWDFITDDPQDALTNDLPSFFRGATVTWSADIDGVVSEDGKVTQYIGVANKIKLTANVEYKGYSFTKVFDVTVSEEALKSVVIPLHSSTFISGSSPSKPQGGYDSAETGRSFYFRYMYPAGFYSGGNDRVTFLKWDFSNYLNELNAARSMSISINASNVQDGGVTLFSVLADGYEDWTETNLTYDKAVESGMYTDPALASQRLSGIKKQMEITSSAEMLNGIKKSIADNPDDGVVNFRWEALGQAVTSYRLPNNVKTYFTVTLYYYESELSEVAKTKVSEMPWSFVSAQSIDSVIANLTLPATFYGAPVTWTSSDETVITSSGEVIVGDETKQVTLTATVNGLTKDFVVTVPANVDFVVKAENNNYSNVFVWAKEAITSETLVVAKYYDDELISVDVREDIALNKGENFIWTKIRSDEADVVIKVMLLDDMGSLKPLMAAK